MDVFRYADCCSYHPMEAVLSCSSYHEGLQCKADVGNATVIENNYSEQMKLIKLYLYNYCALYKRRNHFLIDQTIIANRIQHTSNAYT